MHSKPAGALRIRVLKVLGGGGIGVPAVFGGIDDGVSGVDITIGTGQFPGEHSPLLGSKCLNKGHNCMVAVIFLSQA